MPDCPRGSYQQKNINQSINFLHFHLDIQVISCILNRRIGFFSGDLRRKSGPWAEYSHAAEIHRLQALEPGRTPEVEVERKISEFSDPTLREKYIIIPVGGFRMLKNFSPDTATLDEFLLSCSRERRWFYRDCGRVCAIRIDDETGLPDLRSGSTLLLEISRQPRPGELVLAAPLSGGCVLGHCSGPAEIIRISRSGGRNRRSTPVREAVSWCYRVLRIELNFRS